MTKPGKARISISAPIFDRSRHWRADTTVVYRRCTPTFRSDCYRSGRGTWTWCPGTGLMSSGSYRAGTPLALPQVVVHGVLVNLSQGDRQFVSLLQEAGPALGAHPHAYWIALVPGTDLLAVVYSVSWARPCEKGGG